MESGLEDRNNGEGPVTAEGRLPVSMESGLEDRNNSLRPQRECIGEGLVSMESGLEDRNNAYNLSYSDIYDFCLNGVRPRRPEQSNKVAAESGG